MVPITIIQMSYLLAIYYIFGPRALVFSLLTSLIGMFFVEWINYIEHYGLRRNKDNNGVYESITL